MFQLLMAIVFLGLGCACKERKPLEGTTGSNTQTADPIADPEVINPPAGPAPISSEPIQKPAPAPAPAAPAILIKAAEKYNEFCVPAQKLDITENTIKLTTVDFGLKLDVLNSDSVQCIVTMEATVDKGKRLVPSVAARSYLAALGMLAGGQSLQIDYNILTLNGETIEASLEYQMLVPGPIGSDTEFVRPFLPQRRITPPCQLTDISKRVLILQIQLTLNKGAIPGQPFVTVKDLPRVDYVLENCS